MISDVGIQTLIFELKILDLVLELIKFLLNNEVSFLIFVPLQIGLQSLHVLILISEILIFLL